MSVLGATIRFASQACTHVGCVREVNEDRLLDRPDLGLWAIADGMGGHHGGDEAAALVVSALGNIPTGTSGFALLEDVTRAIETTNATLYGKGVDGGGAVRSGSTFVALLARENHYACLWAGDSRGYLLRHGKLTRITHDHSVVQAMIDGGAIDEQAGRRHPSAHLVTRAVGAGPQIEIDRRFAAILPGDAFLLCSDGLTGYLGDQEIACELMGDDKDGVAQRLIDRALMRGTRDNVSVVVITTGAC